MPPVLSHIEMRATQISIYKCGQSQLRTGGYRGIRTGNSLFCVAAVSKLRPWLHGLCTPALRRTRGLFCQHAPDRCGLYACVLWQQCS